MKDCPPHMVKSIKALTLKDFRNQVNYCFTTYTSPLRVGKLQPKLLKVPITSSNLVSENTNTYIQQREIEYIGIILWQIIFYR